MIAPLVFSSVYFITIYVDVEILKHWGDVFVCVLKGVEISISIGMNKDNDFIPVLIQIGRRGVMVLHANLNNISAITLLSILLSGEPEKPLTCRGSLYHIYKKKMLGSSLSPVVCRGGCLMSYLRYICLLAHSGYPVFPVSLDCIEYTSLLLGFELTTLVVIGTNCTGSCISK